MKKLSIIVYALIICQTISAQALQISGKIISATKQPIEFANVVLRTNDSTFVTGGITDSKGRFCMDNLQTGRYKLQVSSIGFQTRFLSILSQNKNLDLGTIEMDSSAVMLNEVVIAASNVINQSDRKIILPTSTQIKVSSNGFNLLQQLNLKHIQVNVVQKTISASGGGEVQLRINGVKASIQEASALRPEDILRVEHYEDPGLRYQGAEAVINYITRHHDTGGYVAMELTNSPHIGFGEDGISAKINHKNSEFGLNYFGEYRDFKAMWRENSETFHFNNGKTFTRLEDGIPDNLARNQHVINLNYNYVNAGKWFFNATVKGSINDLTKRNYSSMLYPIDKPDQKVHMTDYSSSWEHSPSLDLYFQRTIKNNQAIILNVVGTYIDSNSNRNYTETKDNKQLTAISTNINGSKYSLISEGIYEKKGKVGKLSIGIKHTQSYTSNEYFESSLTQTNIKQSETYMYTEFQGKMTRLNYSVGIGGTRSWFKQGADGYQNYTFRPTLGLTYNFCENTFVRYRGKIYNTAPLLSDLSNVSQNIDSLQIQKGNSNLKPVTAYSNNIIFDTRKGIFSANLYIGHVYYNKPIMEQIDVVDNKFIRTKDNQQSWQKLNSELELSIRPLKDYLTLKWTTGVSYFDSKGNNYHHTYTNWYYRADANANYKNWAMMFQLVSHCNDFFGEKLIYGENHHILGLTYKHKKLTLGMMVLNPFNNNWSSGSENRSAQVTSRNILHSNETSRLFCINLEYNFSFGRKRESIQKRLNNQDTDSGIMSSNTK